jgi:hypothetical protein
VCGCRSLEQENKSLGEARRAGKSPVWNHNEFHVLYSPPAKILKIGDVHVNYLLDNQNDPQAVESLQEPRAFFDKLYLHLVFALAGVRPSSLQVRLESEPHLGLSTASAYLQCTPAICSQPCKLWVAGSA